MSNEQAGTKQRKNMSNEQAEYPRYIERISGEEFRGGTMRTGLHIAIYKIGHE